MTDRVTVRVGGNLIPVQVGEKSYLAQQAAARAEDAEAKAQAWAEGTAPGGPGTSSAKGWAEQAEETANTFGDIITYIASLNLASPATVIPGKYIASNGAIVSDPAWTSLYVPVSANTTYTWWTNTTRRAGSAFMSDPTTYVAASYSGAATPGGKANSISRTTGATTAGIWINMGSNAVPAPTEIMVNLGAVALDYEAWHAPVPYVPLSQVLFDVPLPTPDYVITVQSKNLYNKANPAVRIDGQYIANNGTTASAAGWAHARIPCSPGDVITINWSGVKRQGAGFYDTPGASPVISGSYNGGTTSPISVTAPAGAVEFGFNTQSATQPEPADLMVNEGGTALPYEPFGDRQMINPDYVDTGDSGAAKLTLSANASAGSTLLSLPFDGETLWQALSPSLATLKTASDVFNFHSAALGDTAQTSNGTDDVPPVHMFGWTIGGNHGWIGTNLTKAAHGKTASDIGSIYAEGGVQWKIWDVPSVNVITVTAVTGNAGYTGTTLTHVSGGVNTGSITPTAKTDMFIFPAITNHRKVASVDGVEVAPGTWYPKSNVTFAESYNIPDKDSLVSGATADKASLSMAYRFDMRGGCTINADFLALDTIGQFQDLMFLQCYPLAANGGVLKYLIPDTVPFTISGTDYDFSKPVDMTGALANALFITPARIADPAVWPSRVVQFNGDIGKATGFLPYGSAADDVRPTLAATQALEIRNGTKKIYMHAVDNPSTTALAAGDYFNVAGYETYFALHPNRTASYVVEGPDADWLFIDWHASIVDRIDLPPLLHGRAFEVYRKSTGVTIHGFQATVSLRATVTTSGGAGRYVILKFPK